MKIKSFHVWLITFISLIQVVCWANNNPSNPGVMPCLEISTSKDWSRDCEQVTFTVTITSGTLDGVTIDAGGGFIFTNFDPSTGNVVIVFESDGEKKYTVTASKSGAKPDSKEVTVYGWKQNNGFPDCDHDSSGGNTNTTGSFDYDVRRATSTDASLETTADLQVFENIPFNSDEGSINPGPKAEFGCKDEYVWGGPSATVPTTSVYKVEFTGSGEISVTGTADAGSCIGGGVASASAKGNLTATFQGPYSGSFKLMDIGGTVNATLATSFSGSKSKGDTPSTELGIEATPGGVGSMATTGTYQINEPIKQHEFSGSTLTLSFLVKASSIVSAQANGCVLSGSDAQAKVFIEADMTMTVKEAPKPKL